MALASTGNVTTFDNTKDVLMLRHGRTHIRQKGRGEAGEGPSSSAWTQPRPSYQNRGKGKGRVRFSRPRHAFYTADDG
eukprot:3487749-Pyramimonas_sp.AAC.1